MPRKKVKKRPTKTPYGERRGSKATNWLVYHLETTHEEERTFTETAGVGPYGGINVEGPGQQQ